MILKSRTQRLYLALILLGGAAASGQKLDSSLASKYSGALYREFFSFLCSLIPGPARDPGLAASPVPTLDQPGCRAAGRGKF